MFQNNKINCFQLEISNEFLIYDKIIILLILQNKQYKNHMIYVKNIQIYKIYIIIF